MRIIRVLERNHITALEHGTFVGLSGIRTLYVHSHHN